MAECDVISISKSDYIYEYEIKISRSDFKADFNKNKHKLMLEGIGTKLVLEKNTTDTWYLTPNYFSFVVPKGLVSIDEIPSYAGLIYYEDSKFEVIKKPPIIHKTKATPNFIRQLSHNFNSLFINNFFL